MSGYEKDFLKLETESNSDCPAYFIQLVDTLDTLLAKKRTGGNSGLTINAKTNKEYLESLISSVRSRKGISTHKTYYFCGALDTDSPLKL